MPAQRYNALGQIQTGAYINLRLTAFNRIHLTTGLRWSRYDFNQSYVYYCTNTTGTCAGKNIGDIYSSPAPYTYSDHNISWPPPANLSFDITKSLTLYGGYTSIYKSQADTLDVNLKPLPPITGSNWEGGLKWAARGGKLNLSLAAYRTEQKGLATYDYSVPYRQIRPNVYCCAFYDPNQVYFSQGIDFEATGELRKGLQIAGSYTYNYNAYKGSSTQSYLQGLPLISIAPRHLYKLWVSYDFGAAGHSGGLSGLVVSGGFNGQSSGFQSGYTCVNLVGAPDPVTGSQNCASYAPPDLINYKFTVAPYTVFSGRIDYRLSDRWSLGVSLDNILDKTYYQTTGSTVQGNWYGAPRNVTVKLRAQW